MTAAVARDADDPLPQGWHRRVLVLAAPIVLANLTQPILSAVDTAIAGHLPGEAALGGVALGGLFFNFVFWGFGFLRMGTTGFVAQAYGAGDATELRLTVARALALAVVIGLAVLALRAPLVAAAFDLLGGSPSVRANAAAYSLARIWSAPATLANYVVLGTLLGRQKPRLALLLQVLVNLVNMAAALLLVYGARPGRRRAGCGDRGGGLVRPRRRARLLWRLRHPSLPRLGWRAVLDRPALLRLVAVNRDIFLRTLCLIGSFAWFAHEGAALGDTVLAANAVLLNFQTFMAFGLDGFAHAAEALVGAAVGARDRAAFRAAVGVSLFWSVLGAAGFALVYAAFGPAIIRGLTDQAPVRAAALAYLPWAAASPLASVWCFLLDGVFIGATRTREMRNGMAVALAGFLGAALMLRPAFGNHGLWAALMLFMVIRGTVLGLWLPRIAAGLAAGARTRSGKE